MSTRYYSFCVVTYHTDLSIINSFCSKTFKYAYAFHDKDDSPPHYHIICSFKGNRSFDSVRSLFPEGQNTFVSSMIDRFSSYLYLTHKNSPDKFLYDDSIIVSNDFSYFSRDSHSDSFDVDSFLNDLTSCRFSPRFLALKYGRDFIRNYNRYMEFSDILFTEELSISRGYPPYTELISYDSFLSDFNLWYNTRYAHQFKVLDFFNNF